MIVQEPVQAAIWHCLNHYDYKDAIFLSERLYAEVKTDDCLFLLATAYYRNGQIERAYYLLKDRVASSSSQCRYLLGSCAYQMQKYAEAENAILENCTRSIDDLVVDYEGQAAFALLLLAKVAEKTGRRQHAIDMYKRALKLNPFMWCAFENMCEMGEQPNPATYFQLNEIESMTQCHGTSFHPAVDGILLTQQNSAHSDTAYITPQQILTKCCANNLSASKVCTPDESPLANPLCMSGVGLLSGTRLKPVRFRSMDASHLTPTSPSFGCMVERSSSEDFNHVSTTPTPMAADANENKTTFMKKGAAAGRMHMASWGNHQRKEALLQNSKPVFSQTSNVNYAIAITPSTPASVTAAGVNVRRSSRLFTSNNNYNSVKENNKSPNRNKFATPKSPSRKTKQRLAKCNLNELNNFMELNSKNLKSSLKKEAVSETVTSSDTTTTTTTTSAIIPNNMSALQLQKQSAEGLMCLMRDIGAACLNLAQFNCKLAIEQLNALPAHHVHTTWVYCKLALAYFGMTDYENAVKYFGEVHSWEPHQFTYMDVYSTALWHLQKEVALSALAQDLVHVRKDSPVTWIVSGNCYSLHKEHDTAIKFLHRAVQVDPTHPYAYTILGHEYIMTEELDKAMSCYRNAIRLDPRHFNAWFGIGTIYAKQERYQLAEINYNRALSINPNSSVILCHIGVVQHALMKTEKALATFNAAIAKDPNDALCKFHRGSIYFNIGRHQEALQELEELKEIVPKESLVYYLIGKVHKKLGNIDLALTHFSWATDLDPKGASSQIKEAFDPKLGRVGDMDSSLHTPQPQEQQRPNNSPLYQLIYERSHDESDDSL